MTPKVRLYTRTNNYSEYPTGVNNNNKNSWDLMLHSWMESRAYLTLSNMNFLLQRSTGRITYYNKKTPVRSHHQRTHALVAGLRDCCDKAFSPKNKTLQMCTERMLELVPKVVGGILDEMHDKSKVTWEHLLVFGEEHITNFGYSLSWAFCTAELKEELKGHRSANAITESTLGSTTQVGASFISSQYHF